MYIYTYMFSALFRMRYRGWPRARGCDNGGIIDISNGVLLPTVYSFPPGAVPRHNWTRYQRDFVTTVGRHLKCELQYDFVRTIMVWPAECREWQTYN